MPKALLLLLSCLPLLAQAQREVSTWTYHQQPPLILDLKQRQGLSFDLVELLNQHPDNRGRFYFRLQYLPRKRLDWHLNRGEAGLVLWVNPIFFSEDLQAAASWTQSLLEDEQSFVSRREHPFDYQGPTSLHGRTLGTLLGHRYIGLENGFTQGLIQREDVLVDEQNIHKLLSKRIDLILIPRSTARYFIHTLALAEKLHFSSEPLSRYDRQIMLPASLDADLQTFVQHAVQGLPDNPAWQALLRDYGLD